MEQTRLDRLLTAAELAQRLGIPAKRIRQAIRSGDLPAVRIGEWWRVRASDAEKWLDRQRYRVPAV
jgi:excisionase family DNA binding protein